MSITLNGTTGITTPDITSSGSLNIDASAPDNSLVVNSAGNVGIGTSTTSQRLNVFGPSVVQVLHNTDATSNDSHAAKITTFDSGAAHWNYLNLEASSFRFSGYGTERMRIDSSGNLLVGTTTVAGLGQSIQANGTRISTMSGTGGNVHAEYKNGNGTVGYILSSGSSTSYVTSSDYRLKEDWVAVSDAAARVNALKPINFAWIASGERVDGFLAHELAEVVPEAATGSKDAMRDEEYEVTPAVLDDEGAVVTPAVMGTRSVPDYQGIDQSKLVPLLTAALQEALAAIETLTARVSALEAK